MEINLAESAILTCQMPMSACFIGQTGPSTAAPRRAAVPLPGKLGRFLDTAL